MCFVFYSSVIISLHFANAASASVLENLLFFPFTNSIIFQYGVHETSRYCSISTAASAYSCFSIIVYALFAVSKRYCCHSSAENTNIVNTTMSTMPLKTLGLFRTSLNISIFSSSFISLLLASIL